MPRWTVFIFISAFFLVISRKMVAMPCESIMSCEVDTTIQLTLCEGLTFTLNGIEYDSTGVFEQRLLATNGCDSIITLDLFFFPDPPIIADFGVVPTSCEGAADGSISVLSVSGTRPPFIFQINDSIIPPPNTSVNLSAGTYTVSISNEFGCFYEEEIIVEDGPRLEINVTDDVTISLGQTILLEAYSNLPLWATTWFPPEGLSCPTCMSTQASPLHNQTYIVTAATEAGCIDTDSIKVRVDPTPKIFIPNVFSPNGNTVNDNLDMYADPATITSLQKVLIFDRWGGIISESGFAFNEGRIRLWDGATPQGFANPGTYVYLVIVNTIDNRQLSFSGDVTVVK